MWLGDKNKPYEAPCVGLVGKKSELELMKMRELKGE
jgi:hypothetical protein